MRRGATAAIAGIYNFLSPGLGHLFLGRARRFFVPLLIFLLIVLTLRQADMISTLPGFAALAVGLIGLVLFGIIDGIVVGARSGRDTSRWYSRWYVLLAWVIAIQAVPFFWDGFRDWMGYGIYRMPSAYMRPTLAPGDVFLTSSHVASASTLAPNTLVVFRHPSNGVLYVLRIKEETSPGFYSLNNGLPFPSNIEGVPRRNIVGLVTALIWSPERKEFARALK